MYNGQEKKFSHKIPDATIAVHSRIIEKTPRKVLTLCQDFNLSLGSNTRISFGLFKVCIIFRFVFCLF